MSGKFDDLRQELDSLGYKQKLHPECIPLVQKLLADLNTTTTNLRKYMKISQHALEERDILEFGAEPYKCDNAKLIKECNDLHIAFIHFKEQHEKIQRDLRNQISALQIRLENCNLEKSKIMSQLQQLEKEKYRKASKAGLSKDQNVGKGSKNFEISTAMASAEENNAKLNREFKDLKEKYAKISEDNNILQNQLVTRDEEISRLQSLLQGGRSFKAASKDCCYQNIDGQMGLLQDEVTRLKKEKCEFLKQVKDALAKQHEAMRRALHLAERNRQLEKEMRDIDEIALAVEAECNHTVKDNTEKVTRLQDRINESLIVIQNLERDNAKLKQDKLKLSADLDAVKLEKIHLEKQLGCESEDKKRLTDRINNFTIIENDLNLEIDRLTKLTAEQKRRIMELESQVSTDRNKSSRKDIYREELCDIQQEKEESEMADKVSQTDKRKASLKQKVEHKKSAKKVAKGKVPSRSSSPSKMGLADGAPFKEKGQKCCCESGTCMKNLKELLDKEMEYRQAQALQSIEALQQEKDYYMKEYHRALEQMRNLPTHERTDNTQSLERMQELMEYKQQLKEKEMRIKELENEIRQIKTSLLTGQELSMDSGICNNPNCKRKEREMDMKTNDLKHLDMENNTLKSKLQTLNETTIFNEERMKKAFQDMEEHIRKLEDERRDLVKVEVTQRSNISQLEEDYKMVKEQLRQTQNDLNNQKANYNQLKLLHEQTDRALSDAQAQIVRAETELVTYQSKVRDSTRDTAVYDREIAKLKSDIQIMRNQLTKLDKEKDELLNNLDEKTERIAVLEGELSSKNKSISRLEEELKELKRKLSKYVDDSSTQEHMARSKRQELAIMEQDYEQEKRLKGAALSENRRLQEDLAAVTCDCRDARNELEISRRQVEDLKRQLQHYVAEVKRTEDLISNKELERAELLDQFRCLSQEADILENTNHTLENEATQSKVQLSVALDHTSGLERRLENQESIIRSYEKQISDLTTQIASLEMQLKQQNREQEQYSTEIKQMRDLCVKLDKDKDTLKHELYSKEDYRAQVERLTGKLESEKASLQKILEKERTSLEAVEKLLNEARQDVMEQRLLNQDLQNEVGRLKQKIAELQERITITSEQLDIYQGKALEYSQQNKHLRREIANERFSKAKSDDKDSSGKLESLRKTEEQRLKRAAKDIVHFSNGNEADKRSDNTLYPPYRDQSALSTKTLKSVKNYEYHGSDGIFQGTLDFTKLEDDNMETPSKPTSSALTKPVREKIDIYKGPEDGFRIIDLKRLGNDSEPPSRASSKLSTNSLVHTGKYHGSDGVLNGVIDLTRLETENIDCDEMCEKDKCPLHKKMFLKANLRNEAESNKIGYKRKAKETIKKKQVSLDQDQDCWTNRTAYGGASSKMLESKKEKPQDKRLRPKEKVSPNQANPNHGSYEIFNEVYSPPRSPDPSNEYHGSYETFNKVANITNNQAHDKNNQIKSKSTHKKLDTKNLNYHHGSYEIFNQKAKVTGLLRNDIDRKENNQLKYKETSVNDINYPSAKVESPKSVLCRGSRNNENINNQRDNLCFSAKCLENMKQTQSREKKQSSKAYVQGTSVIADPVFISSKRKSPQQDKISDHSEGIKSSERNTKSPTSTVLASEKPTSNGTNNQKSPEQNLKPTVSYDILWSKCKCQECWSNDSVSEPNMRGQCMSRGLTATNKCRKKNAAEKIKDRVKDGPKLLSENNNSPSAALNNPKKIDAMPSDACVKSTMVKGVSQKLENVKQINNKTSKSTCTNCNAQAQFSQDSDDSAMFRKVFSINGVGLQCHCCISSFKTQDKN